MEEINLPAAAALYTWVATGETRGRSSARVNCPRSEWDPNSVGVCLFTDFNELWIGPKSARFPPWQNALFLIKMYLLVTAANVNLMNKEVHYWQKSANAFLCTTHDKIIFEESRARSSPLAGLDKFLIETLWKISNNCFASRNASTT